MNIRVPHKVKNPHALMKRTSKVIKWTDLSIHCLMHNTPLCQIDSILTITSMEQNRCKFN